MLAEMEWQMSNVSTNLHASGWSDHYKQTRAEWRKLSVTLHQKINKPAEFFELLPLPSNSATVTSVILEFCNYVIHDTCSAAQNNDIYPKLKNGEFYLLMKTTNFFIFDQKLIAFSDHCLSLLLEDSRIIIRKSNHRNTQLHNFHQHFKAQPHFNDFHNNFSKKIGVKIGVKALAHYKDFRKDFSEKIFVKIFVHIQNCWKNRCSCEIKL